jgi:hypothetical protein
MAADRLEFEAVRVAPQAGAARWRHPLRRVLVSAVLLGLPLAAQNPGTPLHLQVPDRLIFSSDPGEAPDAAMGAKRLQALNAMRQKSLVSDGEKLLHLAQELNDDATGGGSTLSPAERLHKASEIQKLAKDIRDKMSYSVGDAPKIATPPGLWQR